MSAELLAEEEIVRLELLAKLSPRYKTIQSVSKRYIRYCSSSLLQYAILCRLSSKIGQNCDNLTVVIRFFPESLSFPQFPP